MQKWLLNKRTLRVENSLHDLLFWVHRNFIATRATSITCYEKHA